MRWRSYPYTQTFLAVAEHGTYVIEWSGISWFLWYSPLEGAECGELLLHEAEFVEEAKHLAGLHALATALRCLEPA
jgi:hypothetical protein